MILWFTYVQVIVAVAAGLFCVIAGLAGRRPSDCHRRLARAGRAAAPGADRHRDHRAVRRQPADRAACWSSGSTWCRRRCCRSPASAWALLERSRWSTVIMGIAALAVAVMVWRMQVIWTVQVA